MDSSIVLLLSDKHFKFAEQCIQTWSFHMKVYKTLSISLKKQQQLNTVLQYPVEKYTCKFPSNVSISFSVIYYICCMKCHSNAKLKQAYSPNAALYLAYTDSFCY